MVELYIDNKLVQFVNPPEINLVLSHSDVHDPTIVRANFSHTIEIQNTKENNKIFNCFYDNTRINGEGVFDSNQKIPFVLYNNGDIVEQGYCKLTEVKKKGNDVSYNIMLVGGLAQFLYSLSYKEDGEELRLSDLTYTDDDDRKLNFVVNRDAIYDAWSSNIWDENSRYSVINFAPCYNGIPSDFDANKVVINTNNLPDSISLNLEKVDDEGNVYTDINGYVLAELPNELDDTQVRDYRSYLQRPIIRMKSILNACFNPNNNNGWEVDLDEDFFNDENPYYNDTWVSLPLLTENNKIEFKTTLTDDKYYFDNILEGTEINASISFIPTCNPQGATGELLRTGYFRYNNSNTFTSRVTSLYYQLVVYDKNDNIVDVSKAVAFLTKIQDAKFKYNNYAPYPHPINFVEEIYGMFKHVDDEYLFHQFVDNSNTTKLQNTKYFNLDVNIKYEEGMYMKLICDEYAILNNNGVISNVNDYWVYGYNETYYTPNFNTITEDRSTKTTKDYLFKKDTHLNSENTPCKYMLDYLKMFNLHIWHDTYENKIHIKKRENYFTHNIKDIDNIIDRGKEMTITPLTFENKWLSFETEYNTDCLLYKDYIDEFGYPYGTQRVNTNYNFDNSKKELFEDNIYKGGIMQQRKNKYYAISDNEVPSFFIDGLTTYLFNDVGKSIEGNKFNPISTYNNFGLNNEDIIPRLSLVNENNEGIDGANILLFFNGMQNVEDYNLMITDDIVEFEILNDETPCWIYTYGRYNINGEEIAKTIEEIPLFSRYNLINNTNHVLCSWDFGTPLRTFLNVNIYNESDIYTQYWRKYLIDKLNIDNRIVTAYVLFNKQLNNDNLRDFYFFDNAYWVLSQAETGVGSNNIPSKCEFYKILDLNNYQ